MRTRVVLQSNHIVDVRARIADDQLERTLAAIAPKRELGFPFEKLLQFLQVLSIVVAAGWTLYNYLEFEKEERTLAGKIQQINLDQQTLTLKQNTLLSDNQQALAAITVKQQEFALQQQQLLALTARDKARLDVRALELENSLKGIQVRTQTQAPLRYQVRLQLRRNSIGQDSQGFGEWSARLFISVGNLSASELFLNSGTIEQYLGTVLPENQKSHIIRFNDPDESAGPIRWEKVGRTDYCSIQGCKDLFGAQRPDEGWVEGGPAFGRLQHDEGNVYSAEYQVRAKDHSVVGFVISWRVEQNQRPWLWKAIIERSTDDETESVIDSQQSSKLN
jgi:hypothetical protein